MAKQFAVRIRKHVAEWLDASEEPEQSVKKALEEYLAVIEARHIMYLRRDLSACATPRTDDMKYTVGVPDELLGRVETIARHHDPSAPDIGVEMIIFLALLAHCESP